MTVIFNLVFAYSVVRVLKRVALWYDAYQAQEAAKWQALVAAHYEQYNVNADYSKRGQ